MSEGPHKKQPGWLKIGLELGPLILFFVIYGRFGIYWATGFFMVSTLASMIYNKVTTGRIPVMLWLTGIIVGVMGTLTLVLQDETFVKMKPTLINAVFALILAFGHFTGRNFLKILMEDAMPPLSDIGWRVVARNWALMFAVMAVLNEVVWRNVSTDMWVSIKTFGYFPLTFAFAIYQVVVMQRYVIEKEGDAPKP